ncbi:MAG: ThiF family adenylyltransferase [Dehalococcoidales bacterium]|nr:ThiF family adenylyltransferase [Dehalococcoidales bacterium]
MKDQYKESFSRNLGLFTESEQEKIRNSKIAIAGLGGVGGLAAERLLRLGVESLKITDPGDMEASNLNRQFGCTVKTLGQNKAGVIFEQIKDINPQANIIYTKTGVKSRDDVRSLIDGCDLIIDVMDFGLFRESILIQREARKRGIHYLFSTAIGFGAITVVFAPDGITLEEYNNLPVDVNVDNPEELVVPIERIVPVIPKYAQDKKLIEDVIAGGIPVPTTSIGAGLSAIQAASEAINIIIGRPIPKAPNYTYFDLVDRQMVVGSVL